MKFGRGIERIIIVVISIGAICLVSFSVYSDFKMFRQRTLFYQLQILRMGVNIHQLINHKNPSNLLELVNMTYKFPGDISVRRFVEGIGVDKKGMLVDPFGNPYSYDVLTGWVRSITVGYEFW